MEEKYTKIEQGKLSLQEMMEKLRPFLPKPDMASPSPSYRWKLEDNGSRPSRHDREKIGLCSF
jgi:hypothetical protein